MHLYVFNLYSQNQNHRGTVALVAQGVLGVLEVPWDLEALPARSPLMYLSFLVHPEHPEARRISLTSLCRTEQGRFDIPVNAIREEKWAMPKKMTCKRRNLV